MTESSNERMENVEGIIDLTLPIRKHWRWGFHRTYERDYAFGDPLREEYLYMPVHCFTHIDPPSHATEDDKTIDQVPAANEGLFLASRTRGPAWRPSVFSRCGAESR